jgi:hypothetical protein
VFTQHFKPAASVGISALMVALILTSAAPLAAQPSLNVTFGSSFDSFRPVTTASESRQNLAGAVNLEHVFADERGRVFYTLDAGNYDSPGDWSFYLHDTGFSYRFGGADPGNRKLFLTGSFVVRQNGEAWSSAEYTAAGGGLNVELHPRDGTTLRTGYRADYRRFSDLSALTQVEQRGFASLLTSFQTRTTLIAEGQVGMKHYDGVVYTEIVPGTTLDPTALRTGSQGRGMGPGIRWPTTPTYLSTNQDGAAGLVSVMGRVAQSLTDRTGVHGQVTLRRTFGSVSPLLVTTPAGFFEDGVYDDPFASDALFLQAGVKHVFKNAAEIAATGLWADKDYTSAIALDEGGADVSGSPLRWDTVALASVTWTQPLLATKTGAMELSADIGYRFIRHRSNDAFYNYTSHAIGVGFSIGY